MNKFLDTLKIIFSTMLIILIINLTGVITIDTIFNKNGTEAPKATQHPDLSDNSGYSTEMRDIGEIFGFKDEPDIAIDSFDDNAIQTTPKIGNIAVFEGENNNQTSGSVSTISGNSKIKTDEIYNKYYAILSGMQGSYQARAEGIVESAKSEYVAAVKAGEKKEDAKQRIIAEHLSTLTALMDECDGEVNGILAQMTSELQSIGADTSPVDELRNVYGSIVSGYYESLVQQ